MDGVGGLISISPATVAELPAALALIHKHLDDELRARQVGAAMADIDREPGHFAVLVARADDTLVGSVFLEFSPGKSALLKGPVVATGQNGDVAGGLVNAAVSCAVDRGAIAIRSLQEPESRDPADVLSVSGFRHVTDALLLACEENSFPSEEPANRLSFERFDDLPDSRKRLADVISGTYRGSQDCFRLLETRSMEDVLADYRAVGKFDPAQWFFAKLRNQDVGCVLLTEHFVSLESDEPPNWELIYLGIIPEFRGKGYAIELVRFAQWICKTSGGSRLTLAVDAANRLARRIYAASGFRTYDRRRVFVKFLGEKHD
jgi:mycothiol synthase